MNRLKILPHLFFILNKLNNYKIVWQSIAFNTNHKHGYLVQILNSY